MEALYLRILSFILSAMMFMFNGISSVFPWILPDEPIQNEAVIYDGSHFDFEGDTAVISDYVMWIQTADEEYASRNDWKYFFTHNLALVKVTAPVGGELTVNSIAENGEVLEVEYTVRYKKGTEAQQAVNVILIATSKAVNGISTKENIDSYEIFVPEEALEFDGYKYRITEAASFNETYYSVIATTFSDYELWQNYLSGNDKNLTAYDETYFENNNLAVYYINVPYENKQLELCEMYEYNGNVDITVKGSDTDTQIPAGEYAVVLELTKEQSGRYKEIQGFMDEARVYPADYFLKYIKKDEYVKVFSDYDTWETYADTYYFLNDSNVILPKFFEEKNLAMISVMLPTEHYSVNVEPLVKNGNSVEVVYSVSEREYASATMVYYCIILAEISKDVTDIEVTHKGFKNRFATFDTSDFNIDDNADPVLISDYNEWKSTVKKDIPAFEKYNESYFRDYAVVLIPEAGVDWYRTVDMLKLFENKDTVEIMYGINGKLDGAGAAYVNDITILVEVTKNIKNTSIVRKDTNNDYLQFKHFGPLDFSGEYFIVSDYETWKACADIEDERLSEYNEAYFENNSVALFTVTTPNTDGIINPYYIYEEDGVLNFGYGIIDNSSFPALSFRTVLVEVSKDVTSVQAENIR